jgi:hypothetical protein
MIANLPAALGALIDKISSPKPEAPGEDKATVIDLDHSYIEEPVAEVRARHG